MRASAACRRRARLGLGMGDRQVEREQVRGEIPEPAITLKRKRTEHFETYVAEEEWVVAAIVQRRAMAGLPREDT